MSPASLGVVTFRPHPSGVHDEAILERINAGLAERIERGGEVFISTGRVRGRYALRMCILNHSTFEQWQISRDLYVVLSGAVAIVVDGESVRALGPGEFFGELAAIDWGAGFGRTRSATVTATEPTRLLVLDWVLVNWLMKAAPAFGERLEAASRGYLAAL
jgi:CRP-like cAMP-binding protein